MLNKIIKRPVLATVISIILVLLGVVGLQRIPMTQFPEIAPPTVFVSGVYPGANAESVIRSVITPLEQAINGVENMQYMTSSASNDGGFSITIVFKQGVNPDQAAVNVQNRVAQVNAQLPAEVIRLGLTTTKQQTSNLMVVNINSEKPELYDEAFLQNYANINLVPELKRIPGVGNVTLYGAKDYSVRVWINPSKLAAYGLVPSDVETAIQNYSFESSPGALGEESDAQLQYVLRYKGKLNKPEEFEKIILRSKTDGSVLRLTDVARIEFGLSNYSSDTFTDGKPSVVFSVIQASGSNANEIAIKVEESLKKFQAGVPDGIKFEIIQNTKDRLDASISQMKSTLIEAFVLVFIVVLVFLQDFRSTIIPAIAVPVSIIGTIFFMYLIGFSVNVLTLFALVLAIGIVVDDAIVVVEAIHAKMEETGENARTATASAMSEISGAIISITLVMSAVFLPVGFMEGPAGVFYKQFSYTLAIAILISAVNALTLSPALCALLLKNHHPESEGENKKFTQRFVSAFNASFERLTDKYVGTIRFLGKRKIIALGALAFIAFGAFFLMNNAQKGFIPEEDDNNLTFVVNLQAGANLQYITREMEKATEIVRRMPEVKSISTVSGFNLFSSAASPNSAMGFITLKNPKERGEVSDMNKVMEKIQAAVKGKIKGEFMIFRNPAVEGFGNAGGVELVLQDRASGSIADFEKISRKVIDALSKRPEIGTAFTSFRSDYPQYEVMLDEDKAQQLGLTPKEIMDVMQLYLTGSQTTDFIRFGRLYRVNVRSEAEFRKNEASLDNIMIRNRDNKMVPVSTLVSLKKVYGPQVISRYNLYNSISVNANAAGGASTGKVMSVIDEVLQKELPKGYSYEYGGLSLQERNSGSQMIFIFGLSILFVYFLLSAQYESYLLPLAVMLSLPTGILGVFIATGLAGIDNNIYVQIALIMLVGLLAKNAILIVEFAIRQRKAGLSVFEAGIAGAKMRLRPILMTSFAFVAGLIPLMFAKGGTAMGNKSISISAAGGMLSGVILGVVVIPVLYMVFQWLQDKVSINKNQRDENTHTI
ncbi:HAE1 family hydrophobic/amphiphilic exporter-1 [Chryseobacterium sp. SORGH_AS909]|uniref:efflux RND transporter permease subunit n=1 Tax=unclassified Chryseobacterium TaxID=2593645 RepID=UPI002786BF74|nr:MULTISPECIES: efflux RND transporter permease subunit [unclassified Chryseobacterium]MDQ1100687.1 HAE1 family hydrophobic/amphiphilic exporter-1 [Chryseobacterium sp. SORGH_AS_1048]MDR6088025.1 HAE1 family hydrophobic/amphiphilic exporter-1 [Chryseobacterium sp. SORGH_AS_0909]MDT3409391.1 HAE1 family hydrophobic/amphiphilic exporter-1 [Pseudacidovorax intermedius]